MKAYIELGWGNRYVLRTEFEREDGTEFEQPGAHWPNRVHSLYVRMWIGRRVFIADSKEGFKRSRKARRAFKLVLGLAGELD